MWALPSSPSDSNSAGVFSSDISSFGPLSVHRLAKHAGGVVHQRNDPGIVQSRRADHADRAHDLLRARHIGRRDHSGTRKREESRFRADEDAHALAVANPIQQLDKLLLL